jgi:hypothetical protein
MRQKELLMIQISFRDKCIKNKCADEMLKKYMKGTYDLPTLALMLCDIPNFDVPGFIQSTIPHEERYLAVERIKKNNKLHIDGVSRLENMFLGECDHR